MIIIFGPADRRKSICPSYIEKKKFLLWHLVQASKMLRSTVYLLTFYVYTVYSLSTDIRKPFSNIIISPKTGELTTYYTEIKIPTLKGIHLTDITPNIRSAIESSGISDGQVNVLSLHTTTAITINEMEVYNTWY